ALIGEAPSAAACGLTGRRLANRPSALRIASSPCSGRTFAFGSDHFGPPTAPSRIASALRAASSVAAGSGSPWRSIAMPPMSCSANLKSWPKRAATASRTGTVAETISGPMPSPGSTTMSACMEWMDLRGRIRCGGRPARADRAAAPGCGRAGNGPAGSGGGARIDGAGAGRVAAQDAVGDVEPRQRAGLDDVAAGAAALVFDALVVDAQRRLALGVGAEADAVHAVAFQRQLHAGGVGQGREQGVDRAVAQRALADLAAVRVRQLHLGAGAVAAVADGHRRQPEALAADATADQPLQVVVLDHALLLAQVLELREHLVELFVLHGVAQRAQAVADRGAAAVAAQHHLGVRPADVGGVHDLVGVAIAQHAVLVDAGFVRERVLAHDRLVALHRHADQ